MGKAWNKPKGAAWGPLLLLALALLLAAPALAPGRTWYSADAPLACAPWRALPEAAGRHPRNPDLGDQDFLYYPFLRFMAEELGERGEAPLWNPRLYGGVPLAGNAQFPLLYPVHGILWLSQLGRGGFDQGAFDRAFLWHALLRLGLAALGGWFWLRRLGAPGPAAFLGALVLGFGGYQVLWLQFTPAQVLCFLPLALALLEGWLQRRSRVELVLAGLCLACSHHGGYPQTSFFLGGFFLLYLAVRAGRRLTLLLPGLLAFAGAGLLALPAWLPFLEYLQNSQIRALRAGDPLWPAGLQGWRGVEAAVDALLLGFGLAGLWRARPGPWTAALGGAAVLLFLDSPRLGGDGQLPLLLWPSAWGRPELGTWTGPSLPNSVEANADFLGAAPLLLLLLQPWVLRRRPDRLGWTLWGAAVLAWAYGAGFPLLLQGGRTALFLAQASRAAVLFPLAGAAAAAWTFGALLAWEAGERRRLVRPLVAVLAAAGLVLAAWGSGLLPTVAKPRVNGRDAAALAVAGGALLWLLRAGRPKAAALALAGAAALDLISFGWGVNPATPTGEIYPATPETRWLQAADQEARAAGRPFRVMGDRLDLRPNTASVYGLDDARGHDCFDPTSYVFLLYGLPSLAGREIRLPQEVGHETMPMAARAFDLLGVRFYVTAAGWAAPPGWREAFRGPGAGIYENLDALPRAFLARDQVWIHRQPMPFADPALDPGRTVFLEDPGARLPGPALAEGEARIVEDAPNRVRIRTVADGWAWLVLLDNHYPGWEARLAGGEELPILRAYGTFRAVAVPPGEQEVLFRYRPRSWRLGLVGAGAGALVLLLAAVLARRGSGAPLAAAGDRGP